MMFKISAAVPALIACFTSHDYYIYILHKQSVN